MSNYWSKKKVSHIENLINIYTLKISYEFPMGPSLSAKMIDKETEKICKLNGKVIKVWEKTMKASYSPVAEIKYRDLFFKVKFKILDWKKNKWRFGDV